MRPVFFVPETIKCSELFRQLTGRRMQMAIIADEYGGTAGLVTIEDLLESIVGNIRDEYDLEDEEFVKTGEDTWEVDGSLSITELEDLLDAELPEGEYDTVGGLMLSQLGHIPEENEKAEIEASGFKFTVLEVDKTRIAKISVQRMLDDENEE